MSKPPVASSVFILNSHPFYPSHPFSTGALLGGDLNNSNGGCPSPVREYSYICSDHEFAFLLVRLSYSQVFLWYLLCIRVFIPNPFQGFLLFSSAPSVIMPQKDQGMPPVTSTDMHGIPCTSPKTCSPAS